MKQDNKRFLYTFCMVLLWSVGFSVAIHSLVTGVCLGVAMGAVFGLYGSEGETEKKPKEPAEEETTQDEAGD